LTVEEEGAQGYFSHEQFAYDRLSDYVRGVTVRRHGHRRGKLTTRKRPNTKSSRIRLGLVDKAFLPSSALVNQIDLYSTDPEAKKLLAAEKERRKQARIGAKKAGSSTPTPGPGDGDDGNVTGNEDYDSDDEIYIALGEFTPTATGTDSDKLYESHDRTQLSTSVVYSTFGEEVKSTLARHGFAMPNAKSNPYPANDYNAALHEIIRNSEVLSHWVKHDLTTGCYDTVASNQVDQVATDQSRMEHIARGNKDDGKHEVIYVTTEVLRAEADQEWDQVRRWLWDAFEVIVEQFQKNYKQGKKDERRFMLSVGDTYHYFEVDDENRQTGAYGTRPVKWIRQAYHDFLIDPPCTVKKVAKSKTTATTDKKDDPKSKKDDDDDDDDDDDGPPKKKAKTAAKKAPAKKSATTKTTTKTTTKAATKAPAKKAAAPAKKAAAPAKKAASTKAHQTGTRGSRRTQGLPPAGDGS